MPCPSSAGLPKMKGGGVFLFSPYGFSVTLLCNITGRAGIIFAIAPFSREGFLFPTILCIHVFSSSFPPNPPKAAPFPQGHPVYRSGWHNDLCLPFEGMAPVPLMLCTNEAMPPSIFRSPTMQGKIGASGNKLAI